MMASTTTATSHYVDVGVTESVSAFNISHSDARANIFSPFGTEAKMSRWASKALK